MAWKHSEQAIIQSYNSVTGDLVLTTALEYYHFGQETSTGANYQGLDMRGEVILLNRNILIQGDKTKHAWPGQFVTLDAIQIDANGNELTLYGKTILDNVEITHMGQTSTEKGAIRFERSNIEDTATEFSSITNTVIHNSGSMAIFIDYSRNISFKDVDVFKCKQVGVVIN